MSDGESAAARPLEEYREYLHFLARLQLGGKLAKRVEVSDVVQQTMLEAHRDRRHFRGKTAVEYEAYLRKILASTLADVGKHHGAQMRDAAREQSLQAAVDQSSARLEAWLAAEQTSPSGQAMNHEQLFQLSKALAQLLPEQRQVVELHFLQGRKVGEIAAELEKSESAVGGLLARGLRRLRELMTT